MSDPRETPSSTTADFLAPESFVIERIFPIRNLVDNHTDTSDDERQTETVAAVSQDQYVSPPFPHVPPEDKIRKLPLLNNDSDYSSYSDGDGGRVRVRRVTERAQMVPEVHGGAPGATLFEGGKATFHRCEDEPIHIPGAIQQYGALLALSYEEDENVLVRIASENAEVLIGYNPEQLFQMQSFCDLLDTAHRLDFLARFDHVLAAGEIKSGDTDLDVFTMTLLTRSKGMVRFWCALHLSAGTEKLVICEFEAQDDSFFPGTPAVQTLPHTPYSHVGNDVATEEMEKSTTSRSQPLRALSLARQQNTRVGYMEMFNSMTQVQSQFSTALSLQHLLDVIVGIVREMTHFHRVMVYRFDKHHNGAVDAELFDPQASGDVFRGLSFPASDIPKQARELYKVNKIRILYDRDSETARLVCRDESDFARPLDLTHSYLRAMSPIHLKYLANMGVRSSMSISLVINNELWGLVACHSYGDRGIRVPLPIRELCRNIGECASINIERLLLASRLSARRPPDNPLLQKNPSGFIAASSADLCRTFDADFGMLSIKDEARTIGKPEPYREALALLSYLQKRRLSTIVSTDNINADFPSIKYPPGIKSIAGMLVIPVSLIGGDFIVFFRKGQLREVRWAGNPYEKIIKTGTAEYLEPRSSFQRWTEKVEGTSKEWTDDQLETASMLSLLYGRFIEVWRQKEVAVQKSRMTRLLLRNSSHEVRTPLNAIINYLEIALESSLDGSTVEAISKAHKASRSLVYVIDDLLNLTNAEDSHLITPFETFNLGSTVSDVISTFRKESVRRGLHLTVSTHPGLPTMVKGDATRLRQVLSNVTSNAFQNSATGGIRVDIRPISVKETQATVSITIQDIGVGMSEKQLDDLFQDFEQILDEDEQARSPATPDEKPLGVGLAVVARYVRNMNGQIKVRSAPGKGTVFTIELPFELVLGTPFTDPVFKPEIGLGRTSLSDATPGSQTSEQETVSTYSATDTSTLGERPLAKGVTDDTAISYGALALERSVFPQDVPLETQSIAIPIQQKRTATSIRSISPTAPSPIESSETTTEPPLPQRESTYPFPDMRHQIDSPAASSSALRVLVAEDNNINARMLKNRLEKTGHEVYVAIDGQSCYDTYQSLCSSPSPIDAILMDIQMPLVDGHASTRMIRAFEREQTQSSISAQGGQIGGRRRRVPIFAVSASLSEAQRFEYVQDGFDGWVLKPIDYGRLEALMKGIYVQERRRTSIYQPGQWKDGGWFLS